MNRLIILFLSLFTSIPLFSQELKVTRDFGVWIGGTFEKKISNSVDIQLGQQIRLFNNSTKFDDYLADLGGTYFLNKNFKLGANIRYTYDTKRSKESENNFRYNLDLNYKGKLSKKTHLHYRVRHQKTYINLLGDYQVDQINFSGFRNKIKLKYKLNKKNKLYVSTELFRLIETFQKPYFNKIRYLIGDNIKSKIGQINLSAGIEKEINTDYPLTFFLLKTIYTF